MAGELFTLPSALTTFYEVVKNDLLRKHGFSID